MLIAMVALLATVIVLIAGRSSVERSLLFYPTHLSDPQGLKPWVKDGLTIGYSRPANSPRNVWLMLHGNAGQAADRAYAIPKFSTDDSVFILEYPGYGKREGLPSTNSFNAAAKEVYLFLRKTYPDKPICVIGESIGSGPASSLAALQIPPDKLVLIVPFDKLSLVAKDHFPAFLVSLIMRNEWDNIAALANFKGPVDIFGAQGDSVIPVEHARALAASIPSSKFVLIDGGHNDWSQSGKVKIENP